MAVKAPFRIIWHWTAGRWRPTKSDLTHYVSITDNRGKLHKGVRKPEANNNCSDGDYTAHTRGCNTGAIGMAMSGMYDAVERPFSKGTNPLTEAQVHAFAGHVADMAHTYGIPNTRKTILSHAEVPQTLGIWQRGKWDTVWLPLPDVQGPIDPIQAGDMFRHLVGEHLSAMGKPKRVKRKPFIWPWDRRWA